MPTRTNKDGKLEYYNDHDISRVIRHGYWFNIFDEPEFEGSCSSSSCSRTHGYCPTCDIEHDDFIEKEEFEF